MQTKFNLTNYELTNLTKNKNKIWYNYLNTADQTKELRKFTYIRNNIDLLLITYYENI